MIVATASPARTALKNSQLTRQPPGEKHAYFGDRALTCIVHKPRNLPLGLSCSFKSISSRAASQAAPERENLTSALAREIFGLKQLREAKNTLSL
jgi:hypothetical protein